MIDDIQQRISSDPQANYRAAIARRFVSLWDMLQLETETFLPALTLLASIAGHVMAVRNICIASPNLGGELRLEEKAHAIRAIEVIQLTAIAHDMSSSLRAANRCHRICVELLSPSGPMSVRAMDQLVSNLVQLVHAVIDEAEGRQFYALSRKAETDHRSADDLFGRDVLDAFPSAHIDLEEAGRCLAFELWTAAVMHLMRALEPALTGLAHHVGVAPGPNWNQTLDQIEKKLRLVTKRTDGAEAEEWASEAGAQLRFIKNAWRNSAMHGGAVYDEKRARSIFETTRSLLQHLAEKLSEDAVRG